MDNEVPLPPPRRIRHRSPANASSPALSARVSKPYRLSRFDDRSSQPSSDPALFSSDDIPASGLENYNAPVSTGAGRKRRYRGTWWGETVSDPKKKRVDFKEKRLVDSGVWMGSDESGADSLLASEDGAWGEDLFKNMRGSVVTTGKRSDVTMGMPNGPSGLQHQTMGPSQGTLRKTGEPRQHELARAIVNDCLEKGQDSVDLSNGNLRTIPFNLLRPLQHLTKLPAINEPPISEDVYSSLEPFLRIFLAGNSLVSLSSEIFELGTLKVLSLRNNKLTSIPPAIRTLTMLQDINVSVNRLEYLPWELLWLIKKGDLKHLIVRPNPLLQIDETEIAQWHSSDGVNEPTDALKLCEYQGPAPEEAWAPIHVATSPVRRFNMEGMPMLDGQPGMPSNDKNNEPSRVPSLREASLVALSRSPLFEQLPDSEIAEFPELMSRLVRQAREVRNIGGRCCSVCHRSFVIPRTEWLEWWDCTTYENGLKGPRSPGEKLRPLPFRRLGCSLSCVPEPPQTQQPNQTVE
ncbi:hypothetical protein ASPWEDRAFT_353125 [Aspergillus wentii DTO 134E9]|uniref:Uncharacterized protein n=1 Tax=Aspergillus wentii DTO 134E9 TaxID=1073089 RepID=A0A1L9RW11_ASPWE|nr:uncharacterized protein ASPWEDRAFT_353125 [Aspergillus wentii DTO 134E9]KAI9929258.1 hypothetical protein MW887_001666 [Aspergillus wentii]OJJ39038.1 hypothetical protein ASPWEDRAFT_353125 [Aspergillus wentii DTO 134E9]